MDPNPLTLTLTLTLALALALSLTPTPTLTSVRRLREPHGVLASLARGHAPRVGRDRLREGRDRIAVLALAHPLDTGLRDARWRH